jgi:L,D-peptidoglycan transpeptidase YkuD (ErfK/YbiS/YcfS/YnhG family)
MLNSRNRAKARVSHIIVRRRPGHPTRAIVQAGPLRLPAAIGRSGVTSVKREGDGATPRATMRMLGGFFRADNHRMVKTRLPLKSIRSDMLWCDAPKHAAYNRLVKAPFAPSHEQMMRKDRLYDVCLVMDWNIKTRKRGCGSAIFFHIARLDYAPTEGCIAISPADMRRLLPYLSSSTMVTVL